MQQKTQTQCSPAPVKMASTSNPLNDTSGSSHCSTLDVRTPRGLVKMLMQPNLPSYDCPGCQLRYEDQLRETLSLLRGAKKQAKRLQRHSWNNRSTNKKNCL